MSELSHSGRPGQKWGIRNYQNPDGTWTELGKARRRTGDNRRKSLEERAREYYSKPLRKEDARHLESVNRQLSKAGVKKVDGGYVLKQAAKIYRMSTVPSETYGKRPLYGSIISTDKNVYKEWLQNGELGKSNVKEGYEYTLNAERDLRIASGQEVVSYISEKFGSKKLKESWQVYQDLNLHDNYTRTYKTHWSKNKDTKEIGEYAISTKNTVYSEINKSLYHNRRRQKEVLKYFESQGYDVIVDAEDWAGGMDFPIIVINPGDKVTIDKVTKIYDAKEDKKKKKEEEKIKDK